MSLPPLDPDQARRFLRHLMPPDAGKWAIELRLFKAMFDRSGHVVPNEIYSTLLAGWYDSVDDLAVDLSRLQGVSAYVTFNPASPDLLARSYNRLAKTRAATSDADILRVEWLYVDLDPVRPADISSTDAELEAAAELRDKILGELPELAASSIWGKSGNGAWILVRLEPMTPKEGADTCASALSFLGGWSNDRVKVDTTTRNPSRVMCVSGTLKCKGSNIPARPWRLATIDSPDRDLVSLDLRQWLNEVIVSGPSPPSAVFSPSPASPLPSAIRPGEASIVDRARAYLAKLPPAISGQGGHSQTFDAACTLVKGFSLGPVQALELLDDWNCRCQPPWSITELQHKIEDADSKPDTRPRGYLIDARPPIAPHSNPSPSEASRPSEGGGGLEEVEGQESDPHRLAEIVLRGFSHASGPTLHYWRDEFHGWDATEGHYLPIADEELRSTVTRTSQGELARIYRLEMELHAERLISWMEGGGEGKRPKKPDLRPVTTRLIGDVLQALRSLAVLPISGAPDQPAWICDDPPWPAGEVIPAANGLVHLPTYLDGGEDYLISPTPEYFGGYALAYPFLPEAETPVAWANFLHGDLWPDNPDRAEALQEWFGYCLTADTSQQKIMLIIGPPRSGKGTIVRVLQDLIGASNMVNPTLSQLATNFGISPLVGKPLAVITDARISGRTDRAAILERLLSISGEDPQTIDRKYRDSISLKLPTRFMLVSNELPNLRDQSAALLSRCIVLSTERSFEGHEDRSLGARLKAELAGILIWAVEGYRRLRERGHFIQPDVGDLLEEFRDATSPITAFLRDRCIVRPDVTGNAGEIYSAWKSWNHERDVEPSNATHFGRALRSAVPGLRKVRARDDDARTHVYHGVALAPLMLSDSFATVPY